MMNIRSLEIWVGNMKICFFSKSGYAFNNSINIPNLKENIKIIKNNKCKYYRYITKVYKKLEKILDNKNTSTVIDNLNGFYNNIDYIKNDLNKIKNYNITLSASHDDTYYIIKSLNKEKEKLMIICFDMHSDTYNSSLPLWKGNVFSKLLVDGYLDSFLVIGVPKYKIKMTEKSISKDIKDKVKILRNSNIKKYIRKYNPDRIFFSIDIDCFNSLNNAYTALEYCPSTILSELSKYNLNSNLSKDDLSQIVTSCIYIKNQDGYKNLFKIGENYLNLSKVKNMILKVKKICKSWGIKFGFNKCNNTIITDITEIIGYDYGNNTANLIINLINMIKEVSIDEK